MNEQHSAGSSNERALLESVLVKFKEADEERYLEQKEWEDKSRKWKDKGDMYGCNFHQGMAAGANWVALFFFRVQRELEALIKATPSETLKAPRESDWHCVHCGRDNDPSETHCVQCEWSRKHTISGVLHERGCFDHPCICGTRPAQETCEGLPESQEPKYTVANGRIVNRASGQPIPDDEPVFILRAKDREAVYALMDYRSRCLGNADHYSAVDARVGDFLRFKEVNPARMKAPDTGAAQKAAAPQCVYRSGCRNPRICEEMGCCQQLGTQNGNPSRE